MMAGLLPPEPDRLAGLEADVSRLMRLVEDLLLLFQAETGRLPVARRPTDLVRLTRHVTDRMNLLAEAHRIIITVEYPPSAVGSIDPDRLDQVLTNILANAVTYCPSESLVRVRLVSEPDAMIWEIHDNGPGIPPAILDRVTEPLVRGDAARGPGHVGLGLAIARAWVSAHGGHLALTSDGHGTHVRITIPTGSESLAPSPGVPD